MDLRLEAAKGSDGSQPVNISGGLQTRGCLGARDYRQRNMIEYLRPQEESRVRLLEKSTCKSSWGNFFLNYTHKPDRIYTKKIPEKISSLHPRLISRLRSPLNTKGLSRRLKRWERGRLYKCLTLTLHNKAYKETGKRSSVKEQNKSPETVSKGTRNGL